jgi:hypothetical protein
MLAAGEILPVQGEQEFKTDYQSYISTGLMITKIQGMGILLPAGYKWVRPYTAIESYRRPLIFITIKMMIATTRKTRKSAV